MVLISNKLKYIYIHIPKTGGSTIKKTLPFTPIKYNHGIGYDKNIYILNTYHSKVDELKLDLTNYYLFTFVRNPYDRLYSSYLYLKKILYFILKI